MRTVDLVVGSVYAARRSQYSAVELVVVIACDRQYGVWYDSYEENYKLFPFSTEKSADAKGVVVVPLPMEQEEGLLRWVRSTEHPESQFPAVRAILGRYTELGDALRAERMDAYLRLPKQVMGDLMVLPVGRILSDIPGYLSRLDKEKIQDGERQRLNKNAVEDLKRRFNAVFAPLTTLGIKLELVLDTPHGAHSRLSVEDLERLADFVNTHSRRVHP